MAVSPSKKCFHLAQEISHQMIAESKKSIHFNGNVSIQVGLLEQLKFVFNLAQKVVSQK